MAQIEISREGGIAVLTINNPPVNALSTAVRAGLIEALSHADADAAVSGIVLIGADRTFVAGADIREFGKPLQSPGFPEVLAAVERSRKPVVAALHGNALGGGLELALSAHFRIGLPTLRLGLPEVNLGLLPGAGGTQRLPRLIGAEKALEMILSGKPIGAREALALGVLDQVVEGSSQEDLCRAAVGFVQAVISDARPLPIASRRQDRVANTDPALFAELRGKNAARWRGLAAQWKIIDCVEAACTMSFEDGSALERKLFLELRDSPQSKALRYVFFAEREAAKIPGLPETLQPKPVRSAAVIGAGTMGGGIAMCFANAGIPVKQLEVNAEALARGRAIVEKNYAVSVERGSMSADRAATALALIGGATDYSEIADCDLVVEAVFEEMEIKQEVFRKLDAAMKPSAVLASNTSTLDIDRIALATTRPDAVIGMHFFSPANVMKLVENIRGELASPETIVTAMSVARQIGKVAVLSGNCPGFIGNRILYTYGRECDFMLEEGATPWQLDKALQAFGFPMGVYLMRDLAGLDVSWRVRKGREATRDKSLRYSPIADRVCERGRFGQKTGAGYYRYEGRQAMPDPEIEQLILSVSAELGIARRAVSDEEIVMRVMCAMVNEGAKILEEGIAIRASDIDVIYLNGYGFPRYRGGPMFWAEQEGLAKVLKHIRGYRAEHAPWWVPSPLLERLAAIGEGWAAAAQAGATSARR